eukprot:SAG22_NODE_1123_length_5488_cov_53.464465_7_plen_205_part_00
MAAVEEVDRAGWLRDGYLIVRGLVPPRSAELQELRDAAEAVCAANEAGATAVQLDASRGPGAAARRLAEFVLSARVFGVVEQLLHPEAGSGPAGKTALYQLLLVRSPSAEMPPPPPPGGPSGTDPRNWHRDHRPDRSGPLSMLQTDLVRQRSSLLKAVITAFSCVSLPFLAVPLRSYMTVAISWRTGRPMRSGISPCTRTLYLR